MNFEEIIDKVVNTIAENSEYSKEQIKKLLTVCNDHNRKDFCIFFDSISKNPIEAAKEMAEKLKLLENNINNSMNNLKISENNSINNLKNNNFIICNIENIKNCIVFDLNKKLFFGDIFKLIQKKKELFGNNNIGNNKNAVIEYSSPNIAKIFHVGHFRTTILGNFVKNICKISGYNTTSINYLGDWGKQFGLVLLGYEKYGSEEELKKDPLMHLFQIYVRINKEEDCHDEARQIFYEMETNKNEKYLSQWRFFREMSIERYKSLYKKLNVEFDVYDGESMYSDKGMDIANNTTLAKIDKDGSKIIDCGKLGKVLIQKSDGTTLYMTRDIAAAIDRFETYKPDLMVYVVASQQDKYLQQLFDVLGQMGYDKSKLLHINYGMVKGMSTREGTVHFIEDVIETSTNVMLDLINEKENEIKNKEEVALNLAMSFLLISDFSAKRVKGYTFNIEERAKTQKGQAVGPTLQYTHCRLKSIEKINSHIDISDFSDVDFSFIDNSDVHKLAYKLLWYENAIKLSLKDFEPSRIVLYLADIAKSVNGILNKLRVKGADDKTAKARLLVLNSARIVIKNGLELLGVTPLSQM